MIDHHPPGRPPRASAAATGTAAQTLTDRIMMIDRPQYVRQVPGFLDPDHSGLALCGPAAPARTLAIRSGGYAGVLLEDSAAYEKEAATADEPFSLPTDVLFGGDLDSVLQQQLDRGATAALTPTRYLNAGNSDALKAVMKAVTRIRRDDVIVLMPVSVAWLRAEYRAQFTAVLRNIPHPVALSLGGQYDPLSAFRKAPEHLRDLLGEAPGIGLWRTDLAGFDALAHGGSFAAIGAGSSLRHLVPAGERPEAHQPFAHFPSVLVPELLRFKTADSLDEIYADAPPPRCSCPVCSGGFLQSFAGRTAEVRARAHTHNTATWNSWLPGLLAHRRPSDRQRWWKNRCEAAVAAHLSENARIKQAGRFKPPPALKKWAELPLRGATQDPSGTTVT